MQLLSPDTEILALANVDKRKAFKLAFDHYWEPLYRQAFRKVQSEHLAKDLTQEVFIILWNNLNRLDGYDQLLPYLYAVLRNKVLQHFEKDAVRLRYAIGLAFLGEISEETIHQALIGKELDSIITEEIDRMPPRMKEIYVLKKNSYFSIKDIAEKLCLSEQTVKNQLQSAKNRLRLRLRDYAAFFMILTVTLSALCKLF